MAAGAIGGTGMVIASLRKNEPRDELPTSVALSNWWSVSKPGRSSRTRRAQTANDEIVGNLHLRCELAPIDEIARIKIQLSPLMVGIDRHLNSLFIIVKKSFQTAVTEWRRRGRNASRWWSVIDRLSYEFW
jgi:hypothetical protein